MKHLYRTTVWILAVILTCLCVPAAYSEAGTGEQDVISILYNTMEQNPAEGVVLSEEEADDYCRKLYQYLDWEVAESVFYGDADTMAELLKPLSRTLYQTDALADVSLEDAQLFYACVWTLMQNASSGQEVTRPYIKETMIAIFSGAPEDAVISAADECIDYIGENDPELAAGGYYKYGAEPKSSVLEGSEDYIRCYEEGYQLFEEGKYAEAIEAYLKCLAFKENDPVAGFEIAEAYISMRDYENAKKWLAGMAPYLDTDSYRARCLRRYGFIAIEELDYDLGYAFYVYSLEFEQNLTADQELAYIRSVAPDTRIFTAEEAEAYLGERGFAFAFAE